MAEKIRAQKGVDFLLNLATKQLGKDTAEAQPAVDDDQMSVDDSSTNLDTYPLEVSLVGFK